MNEKGKIITWSIVCVLLIAIIVVIATQLMNGGAKKIDREANKNVGGSGWHRPGNGWY